MDALIKQAKKAYEHSYVPYSKFPVGAAIELEDGTTVTGCNIENASYGLSMCAERTALFKLVSSGIDPKKIKKIVIATPQDHLVSPCGACRQVMRELMPLETQVFIVSTKETFETTNEALLPFGFDADDL